MGGVQCYVSWPLEGAKCGIIVFQDVFGIHTGRHKQLCDILSEKGYGAVAPDFTGKDPIVSNVPMHGSLFSCFTGFMCAICSGSYRRKTLQLSWDNSMGHHVMNCVVPWMQQKGATKLGTVGFCFGCYGAICCGRFSEIFSCHASFHPSTEGVCKSTNEDDLWICRSAKVPQLVVATSMESDKWKPGGAAQHACEEDGTKTVWLLEERQKHGFMMRGDTSNAETFAAIKKYRDMMLDFFESNMH